MIRMYGSRARPPSFPCYQMNLAAPFSRLFASEQHGESADQNGGFDLYVTKKSYSPEDAANRNGVTRFKGLDEWALIV